MDTVLAKIIAPRKSCELANLFLLKLEFKEAKIKCRKQSNF